MTSLFLSSVGASVCVEGPGTFNADSARFLSNAKTLIDRICEQSAKMLDTNASLAEFDGLLNNNAKYINDIDNVTLFLPLLIYALNNKGLAQENLRQTALLAIILGTLLSHDANVNVRDDESWTPLMWEAQLDNVTIAKILIERSADINARDDKGNTALIIAAGQNHLDMVRFLVEQKADIHAKTKDGLNALDIANKHAHGEVAQYLYEQAPNQSNCIIS